MILLLVQSYAEFFENLIMPGPLIQEHANETEFELLGKHSELSCNMCHANESYEHAPQSRPLRSGETVNIG